MAAQDDWDAYLEWEDNVPGERKTRAFEDQVRAEWNRRPNHARLVEAIWLVYASRVQIDMVYPDVNAAERQAQDQNLTDAQALAAQTQLQVHLQALSHARKYLLESLEALETEQEIVDARGRLITRAASKAHTASLIEVATLEVANTSYQVIFCQRTQRVIEGRLVAPRVNANADAADGPVDDPAEGPATQNPPGRSRSAETPSKRPSADKSNRRSQEQAAAGGVPEGVDLDRTSRTSPDGRDQSSASESRHSSTKCRSSGQPVDDNRSPGSADEERATKRQKSDDAINKSNQFGGELRVEGDKRRTGSRNEARVSNETDVQALKES